MSKEDDVISRVAATVVSGELLTALILAPWWTEVVAFYFGRWI